MPDNNLPINRTEGKNSKSLYTSRIAVDRAREALGCIPVGGHDERVRVAFMLKSEFGESGRDLWDEWRGDRGNDEAEPVWRSASESGGLTIGSLFYEAKANGWRDDGSFQSSTPAEIANRQRIAADRATQNVAEMEQERANTAEKAASILAAATEAKPDHPYLVRKQVSPVSTLREIGAEAATTILGYPPKSGGELLKGRLLVIPIKQGDLISSVELIDGEKRKSALAGRGSKVAGYWATEDLPDGTGDGLSLQIGEGVATVLTASEATGHLGIAALSSSNLPAVAKAMRERYPAATMVVLADLEKAMGKPDAHAVKAAQSVGGKLAIPDFGADRDPDQTDFNDMAAARGLEAVTSAVSAATAQARRGHQVGWPEPQPLTAKIASEPYPIDALPKAVRAAVEEVSGFVKAPLPLVASSALAALSLACQAHVDAKRAEKLHGPAGLFLLTIADSGERKSTCDGFFTKAIRDYQDAQAESAQPVLKDHLAAAEVWEARRAGIKAKIQQLARDSKPTADKEAALRDLEHEQPEPPRIPRLLYTDATPEALSYGLAKHWPSGGVVSAEAGIVFGSHGMGKDSVMRNLGLLNQLWDGTGPSIDRRSTESFTVRGARLTVALQVQEPTLREFFTKSGALARGTGFLARFLVAWPETTQGQRQFTEAPADWPHLEAFHQRIAEILDEPVPIGDDGALSPLLLPLAPDAKQAWVKYHDAIECELSSGGEFYDVRDVASKSADNAVRLAALFQMFGGTGGAIGLEAFEGASKVAAWHLREALRFFGQLALPEELADAVRLDGWIVKNCCELGTVGKTYVRQRGPLRDGARLSAALKELEELDRLQLRKNGRRLTIHVNPMLVEEVA